MAEASLLPRQVPGIEPSLAELHGKVAVVTTVGGGIWRAAAWRWPRVCADEALYSLEQFATLLLGSVGVARGE